MFLDDAVGYGKPEASALADIFGRKKRFENALQSLFVHARTVVSHGDAHEASFTLPSAGTHRTARAARAADARRRAQAHLDHGTFAARLHGIDDQVGDDLLHLG